MTPEDARKIGAQASLEKSMVMRFVLFQWDIKVHRVKVLTVKHIH